MHVVSLLLPLGRNDVNHMAPNVTCGRVPRYVAATKPSEV